MGKTNPPNPKLFPIKLVPSSQTPNYSFTEIFKTQNLIPSLSLATTAHHPTTHHPYRGPPYGAPPAPRKHHTAAPPVISSLSNYCSLTTLQLSPRKHYHQLLFRRTTPLLQLKSKVVRYWKEPGVSGCKVFKFHMKRIEGQPKLTTTQYQLIASW
ncbi:hypothetical protein RND81_14G045100 [Saponaria officinalis]|uniref:Uncharacterized protein n=1 Tax=Saponaria officinalis TaxID=3572 RepID=A0AAW1GN81_SAPOF